MSEEWKNTFDKLFIFDTDKQREWDELDPSIKKETIDNLHRCTQRMSLEVAIEMIAFALNDVHKKTLELEKRIESFESSHQD